MTIRSLLEHVGVDVAGKKIFVGDREVDPLMPMTRAKFRCNAEIHRKWGALPEHAVRSYEFMAVYDPDTPEDQRYAKATPTGRLEIQVDNPAVVFEPGKDYYLDFTPVAP